MLSMQVNRCGICYECEWTNGNNGKLKPLSIDHCHKTRAMLGKRKSVRGLLCHLCNMALGLLENRPILLTQCKPFYDYALYWRDVHAKLNDVTAA
jgi:hypothetical protein